MNTIENIPNITIDPSLPLNIMMVESEGATYFYKFNEKLGFTIVSDYIEIARIQGFIDGFNAGKESEK